MRVEARISGRDRFWRRLLDRRRFTRRLLRPRVALRLRRLRADEVATSPPVRVPSPVHQQTSIHTSPSISLHLHLAWPRWLSTVHATTWMSSVIERTVSRRTTVFHRLPGSAQLPLASGVFRESSVDARPRIDTRLPVSRRTTVLHRLPGPAQLPLAFGVSRESSVDTRPRIDTRLPTTPTSVASLSKREAAPVDVEPKSSRREHIVSVRKARNQSRSGSLPSTMSRTLSRALARIAFPQSAAKTVAAIAARPSHESKPLVNQWLAQLAASVERAATTSVARKHPLTHEPGAGFSVRRPLPSTVLTWQPAARLARALVAAETLPSLPRGRAELYVRPVTRTLVEAAVTSPPASTPTPAPALASESARSVSAQPSPQQLQPLDVGRLSEEVYRQIERRIRIERERRGI